MILKMSKMKIVNNHVIDLFKKETGILLCENSLHNYITWLENKVTEPQILSWIKKMFAHAKEKNWYETYWAFDIHGTVSIPDYRKGIKKDLSDRSEIVYYPFAKETLQLFTKRDDIIMIMFTSSYPPELEYYVKKFKKDGIEFKYINENPEVSDSKGAFGYYEKKMYFNVLFEDKAGFNPLTDWKHVYDYMLNTKTN